MTSHGFDLAVGDRAEAARHPGRFATLIVDITEQHGKVKVLLSDVLTLNAEDVRYPRSTPARCSSTRSSGSRTPPARRL